MDNKMALKTWELTNDINTIPSVDEIYSYNKKQQQDILTAKPWEKDVHFFKVVFDFRQTDTFYAVKFPFSQSMVLPHQVR